MGNDKPKRRYPTAKQSKFLREYLSGNTIQQSLINAGYKVKPELLNVYGQRMLSKDYMREEFNRLLDSMYPSLDADIARFVSNIFRATQTHDVTVKCPCCNNEFQTSIETPAIRTADQIRMFEALAKVRGWNAPQKSAHVHVDIDSKFKLPEE